MRVRRSWHCWKAIAISWWPQSALHIVAETGVGVPPADAINRHELVEGLSLGIGEDLVIDVIDVFLHDAPALVSSIREGIALNDTKGMMRVIYTLKSSAVLVAAHARDGRTQEILSRLPELAALVDESARELAVIQSDLRRSQRLG